MTCINQRTHLSWLHRPVAHALSESVATLDQSRRPRQVSNSCGESHSLYAAAELLSALYAIHVLYNMICYIYEYHYMMAQLWLSVWQAHHHDNMPRLVHSVAR